MVLIEASPVIATILVLAWRRGRMLEAGLAGLVLALGVTLATLPPEVARGPFLLGAAGRGLWLAWHAAAVMLSGLLFHEVVRAAGAEGAAAETLDHRRLWLACFLLGPFFEAATGFGIGVVILVPVLRRLGMGGASAVAFGLFSQAFVPWGALAIGTVVGAGLAGMDLAALGTATAWLYAPLLLVYLVAFWSYERLAGRRTTAMARLDDVLWTALLWALILLANAFVGVETAALGACGVLLPLRWWRDARPSSADWRRLARRSVPYAALTAVLLVGRGVPAVSAALQSVAVWRPEGDLAPFALFHHAAFWLATVAVGYGAAQRVPWRRLLPDWARTAARPIAVTLVFLVMAELMAESGASQRLAGALAAGLGPGALAVTPLFAATAGWLTGTNIASNALLMPLQIALAHGVGAAPRWVAGLQNLAGANFTLLSPVRVAMGCALAGDAAAAREASAGIYRLLAPLGLAMLLLFAALGAVIGWCGGG